MADISVIIPTYNRHHYLERILKYYDNSGFDIWVLDSTETKYENNNNFNINYIHTPNLIPFLKIKAGLKMIETEFAVFCADDDFAIKDSIKECANFLIKNPDYSCVQGVFVSFNIPKNDETTQFELTNPYSLIYSQEEENTSKRIIEGMARYMHTFYSVQRTSCTKKVWENIPLITRYNLFEIVQAIGMLIMGKYKMLPISYAFRELPDKPPSAEFRENIDIIAISPLFQEEYNIAIDFMASLLKGETNSTLSQCKQDINKALNAYINDFLPWCISGGIKSISVIDKIPSLKWRFEKLQRDFFNRKVQKELTKTGLSFEHNSFIISNDEKNENVQKIKNIIIDFYK